jgi:branched-chain amino acid aminotransferase
MVTVRHNETRGWFAARVEPFGPVSMSPATAGMHYGQEIFEGLKAYRRFDGGVQLFRPEMNAQRFRASARRLAMPQLPDDIFLSALAELITADRAWLSDTAGASLYLRPFLVAAEQFIGMRPATEYLFSIIACPVPPGPIAATPFTVLISEDYSRAAPGGTGEAKCAGNYAASMPAQANATAAGCDQVVFLDATSRRYVEELSGMNIFFVFDDGALLTPPLGGTILPGITRDSVITIADTAGNRVQQRPYTVEQWRADASSCRLQEVFCCGTAAVITAIGAVRSSQGDFTVGDGSAGPVTERLRATLTGIQSGRIPDTFRWTRQVG